MEKFNLRSLIEIILNRKMIIIGITVLFIAVAAIYQFVIVQDVYQATAVVEVYSLSEDEEAGLSLESILGMESFSPNTYESLIRSDELLETVIDELEIEEEYTVNTLSSKIGVDTDIEDKTITILVKSEDPEKSAAIANSVAENFILLEKTMFSERAEEISKQIKEQLDQAEKELIAFQEEENEYFRQPRSLDEVSRELMAKLGQITFFKTDITELEIRLAEITVSLKVINEELSDQQPTINTSEGPIANELYVLLRNERANLSAEYEGINARISQVEKEIVALEEELQELRVEENEKQNEAIQMQNTEAAIRQPYEFYLVRYEKLEGFMNYEEDVAEFIVATRAQPPTSSTNANKIQIIIVSAVLAFIISLFVVFFIEYWEITKRKYKSTEGNL